MDCKMEWKECWAEREMGLAPVWQPTLHVCVHGMCGGVAANTARVRAWYVWWRVFMGLCVV